MRSPADLPENALSLFRFLLKDTIRDWIDFRSTDQSRGVAPPPIQKPADPGAGRVSLPPPADRDVRRLGELPLGEAIARRESVRRYGATPLRLPEVSLLLWATQGVRKVAGPTSILRTVPSAGNRHALETYLYCRAVDGVEEGLYRYLPLDHELVHQRSDPGMAAELVHGCRGQAFAGAAAATFIWTAIPYRMEWRYSLAAHKVIAIDAGHACQNLYLACQSIGSGTCAIAAYDQKVMDDFLGVDGEEEFVIYIAPVGKVD